MWKSIEKIRVLTKVKAEAGRGLNTIQDIWKLY